MTLALDILKTLVVLWHVLAFAFGVVYVTHSYRAILGYLPYDRAWTGILRSADVHLWLSGLAIIVLGMATAGFDAYLANPKLWAKTTVVIVWLLSTQFMRHYAMPRFLRGRAAAVLTASGVNVACWLFGAFLGCAKGMANGAASYELFLSLFGVTLMMAIAASFWGFARAHKATI